MNGHYKTVVHNGRRYFVIGKDGLTWVPDEGEIKSEPTALGRFWHWIKASEARIGVFTSVITIIAFGTLLLLLHHFLHVDGSW